MSRKLLQQALDALRQCEFTSPPAQRPIVKDAITALREALAAPMPEPIPGPGHDCSQCRTPQACKSEQMCLSTLYRGQFPPAAPAPGDMVMVPREPTPEMLAAADKHWNDYNWRTFADFYKGMIAAAPPAAPAVPIDMVLHCPKCGKQHVDASDPWVAKYGEEVCRARGFDLWTNPPHKSHLCRLEDGGCGHIWRPADVPTNGVAAVRTKGKADMPLTLALPDKATVDYVTTIEVLRARIAMLESAAPVVREPQSREQQIAIREAHCNTASDEYFGARPQVDDATKRRIYEAGFKEGWESGIGGGGK